jgi:predicted MPP superfamily phosphohydrolase
MSLFLFIVFAAYSGMHVYAFLRARTALGFGPGTGIVLALFMLLMVVAIFLVRFLEIYEYERTARSLAYLAYCWMALLFLFFSCSLVIDILNLLIRGSGWLMRMDIASILIMPRIAFFVSVGLALVISVYGYFEALSIGTEQVRIETTKLPAGMDRLTVVQISDVHLGLIVRCDRLRKMLEVVKAAKPDILISSGDLVDAQINHMTGLAELLKDVKPKYGKYAITGNHEYFAGIEKSITFTKECGFRVLRNEAVTEGPITIVGLNDRTGVRLGLERPVDEKSLFAAVPRDKFVLLLKHQPLIDQASLGLFDLQISGHTHKGQIFPFTLLTLLTYPLNAGDYTLGKGSYLHVSRGTGTWGPPIRFLSPPEVTIYEIVKKDVF